MTLEQFQHDLTVLDDQRLLDRYYYSGPAAKLDNGQAAELRRCIAAQFQVPMRDVVVVGSAKLGFTLTVKPDRPIFSPFNDESDIDVAIISEPLYQKYWKVAYRYWLDSNEWPTVEPFRKYMFRGWVRPDLLPKGEDCPEQREWWDFLLSLQAAGAFGPYKIRVGVYHDEDFWESYACSSFQGCRNILENPL